MDPATIIAGVGTGVKGGVALFNLCVGLYDLVDRGSAYGKNHTHLMTKLDVEKFRLLAWGEALRIVGLDPDVEYVSSKHATTSITPAIWQLIERVLCCMREVFDDTRELNRRYGLKQVNSKDLPIDEIGQNSSLTSTQAFAATFRRFQSRIIKTQKNANILAKTRWAVYDSDKFTSLIDKLHGWNNDLDNILKILERTAVQRHIMEQEFHIMDNPDDICLIEEVTAESNPTISDTASSRLKILQERPTTEYPASSFSDTSFWTAPSTAHDSLQDQSRLPDNDLEYIRVDMASQNQRLAATLIPQAETDMERGIDLRGNSGAFESLQKADALELATKILTGNLERALEFPRPQGLSIATAHRRCASELKQFFKDAPNLIPISPHESNLLEILACVLGPVGTPYENGLFFIFVALPEDYPHFPPICVFITKIYHPNISPQGRICADVLTDLKIWSPAWGLRTILLAISGLLSAPNVSDPLVPEIAAYYLQDRATYDHNARLYTQRYAVVGEPMKEELEIARGRSEQIRLETKQRTTLGN